MLVCDAKAYIVYYGYVHVHVYTCIVLLGKYLKFHIGSIESV